MPNIHVLWRIDNAGKRTHSPLKTSRLIKSTIFYRAYKFNGRRPRRNEIDNVIR